MSKIDYAFLKSHNNMLKKEQNYHKKRRKKIWKEAGGQQKNRPYSIMNIDLSREFKDLDPSVRDQVKSYYESAKTYKAQYLEEEKIEVEKMEKVPSEEDQIYLPLSEDTADLV